MDTDYARSMVNKRSTIEYCTFLNGNLVTSSKKHVIAWSSTEVEFPARLEDCWKLKL